MTYPTNPSSRAKLTTGHRKLGEVCEVKKGKKPELFGVQTKTRLPYLEAKFMRGTKEAKFAEMSDKNSVPVSKSDLIIICDGSKSGDVFSGFEGVLSSTMGRIDFDKKQVEKMYLELFLKVHFDLFNSSKKGAAIPHLDFNIFKNLKIPLPPITEQKKIVARLEGLLGKIKEAKRLRAEAQEAAQNLLPAELHRIFTQQHITPHKQHTNKLENVGMSGRWEEKELGDKSILQMTSGGTPSRSNPSFYNGKIIWLKSGELQDNTNITNSEEMVLEEAIKNSSAKIFPVGAVLFAMYGATAGKIGMLGVKACTNQAVAGMIPVVEKLNNKFLYYFLMQKRDEIISQAWGGAQPNLSQTILKNIKIPLPPIAEQKKIVAHLDSLSEKIKNLREYQAKTAEDFKSLEQSILSKAFTGNLV